MVYYNIGYKLTLIEFANHLSIESPYFIIKEIFDGGMGTCYKIEDCNHRFYALKIIHSDLILNEMCLQRYYEEIKLWKTFSSCNGIAEALFVTKVNEIPCVISKWMNNGDLSSFINETDPVFFYQSMDRLISTLMWVKEKHNVIHRDLKPQNILLDENKDVYIADWGLARIIYNDDKATFTSHKGNSLNLNPKLTQDGAFVGTVLYASPEQLLGKSNIDHRSDIYSLGCIMYQWETGKPPFVADTINEIASGHMQLKPQKIAGIFKKSKFRVEKIIMRCLEKDPNNRYQSYDELLADIREIAKRQCGNFKSFELEERYLSVNIGYDEFCKKLKSGKLGIVGDNRFGILCEEDITPYLSEAFTLLNIGESDKAISIYERLYSNKLCIEFPDFGLNQHISINLSLAYSNTNQFDKAIDVLMSISNAIHIPAEYYVNLSNLYIKTRKFQAANDLCVTGLKHYPYDTALIGNNTIALSQLGNFNLALEFAKRRLSLDRNIHSISELADVFYNCGEVLKNVDFPLTIEYYREAIKLYRETVKINPKYQIGLYNIALLLYKMKRYSDSLDFCKHISEIEKGYTPTNALYVCKNCLQTSQFDTAIEISSKFIKANPNNVHLQRILAQSYADGYSFNCYDNEGYRIIQDQSVEFFEKIKKNEDNRVPSDIIYLAKLNIWMGEPNNLEYANRLLKWGREQYPDYWQFDFYLSSSNSYNLDYAIECNKKAPWREATYTILEKAYLELDDNTLAQKMAEQYKKCLNEKERLYQSCAEV